MKTLRNNRGLLSGFLAAVLVLYFCMTPVCADEVTDATEALPLFTQPAETVPLTQPTEATEETLSPETTQPAAETIPPETTPDLQENIPPETAASTQPEETIPETAPAEKVTMASISFAKTLEAGTEDIDLQGTVVYADRGLTVLQDRTGGICLTFAQETQVSPGLVMHVNGTRTEEGLLVQWHQIKGSTDLPEKEATLESAQECTRVVVRNAIFRNGTLVQGATVMPMTPANPEGIRPGDAVNAWGVVVDSWFYADTVTPVKAAAPAEKPQTVTATPPDGILVPGESIGLHCATENAAIYYATSADGETYTAYALYDGEISAETTPLHVRAYAVSPEGEQGPETEFCFTAEDVLEEPENTDWNLYFGLLHAHTEISDGTGTVEEAFAHAAQVPGLDFFAVTDHSESFDNDDNGAITTDGTTISAEWAAGKDAAAKATTADFLGIFGYEMTWHDRQQLGHINTFNTPGWQSRSQEAFDTLESYYEALTKVPGSVSQFNHPGVASGYFQNFANHTPRYDAVIQLLEVGSEDGYQAYAYYTRALEAGWHVAPTNNQANHEGLWGDASSVRTVVLAQELTEESLYEAMRNRRVYATEDCDLEIRYCLNGSIMGSILKEPAHTVTVSLMDPTDTAIGLVEVVANGDVTIARRQVDSPTQRLEIPVSDEHTYYYLRITQADGDIAVTAPVWVDLTVDAGIAAFGADTEEPVQGEEIQLSVELYNQESENFTVESITVLLAEAVIHKAEVPCTVPALDTFCYSFPLRYDGLGSVEFTVQVQGKVGNIPHMAEATLALCFQPDEKDVPLSAISYVRSGESGAVYKVRGYVTAGTASAHSSFPETIYLQDETGGIAIRSFTDRGIQVGAPLEVTGVLTFRGGNPALQLLNYTLQEEDYYRYVPRTMLHEAAMDYEARGGQLLQVEGQVVSLTRTADGKGISRLVLKDIRGDLATISIEDTVFSDATGVNHLYGTIRTGRTVRGKGILHKESDGTVVLRVRNCDEVVYVPPVADPSNPKTGDSFRLPMLCLSLFGSLLLLADGIRRKRK